MKRFETLRLWISQYYDDLINQIDIIVENQLLYYYLDKNQQNEINSTRYRLLNEINMIKKHNLENLNRLEIEENETDFIIQDIQMSMIFNKFCFFVDQKSFNYSNDEHNDIGFLVVTDFYLDSTKISNIIDVIRDEWQFVNSIKLSPIARGKNALSMEMIYSYEIMNKIINKNFDSNQVIKITRGISEPIRLNEIMVTKIEESLLDEIPIVELNITYLEDLLSLNNAAKYDNYTLETLIVHYTYNKTQQQSKLSELNLDKLKGLKKLHLINEFSYDYLGAEQLNEKMFYNLNNLEDLIIHENFKKPLNKNQFKSLKNLKKLSFSRNYFSKSFYKNDFVIITDIDVDESIDIFQPNILLENIFFDMNILTDLHLNYSGLEYDDLNFLKYLPNLENLKLRRNEIDFSEISQNTPIKPFEFSIKLKHLDLSSNPIFYLNYAIFEGLDNLESLIVEDAEVKKIEDNFFVRFKNLKTLNLCGNYLLKTRFKQNENTFKGLESVEILFIASCFISDIDVYKYFPNLKHLYIPDYHRSEIIYMDNQYKYNHEIDKQIYPESLENRIQNIFVNEISYSLKELENLHELYLNFYLYKTDDINNFIKDYLAGYSHLKKLIITITPNIETLGSSIFSRNFECLDTLYLNMIGLTHLDDDIFDRLVNLESLSLKENKLKSIDGAKLFKNLNKLEYLDLESNQIKQIHPHSFDNLLNLKYLLILNNPIFKMDSSIFHKLTNLQALSLEINHISLTKDYFKNLKKLYQLKICLKFIDYFNEDIFYYLTSLNCLTFFNSDIYAIRENLFRSLENLIYLKFEETQIRFIHPKAFSHSFQLITLMLQRSFIEEFDLNLLKNQKRLRILDSLGCVLLKKFDFQLSDRFPDLRVLFFRSNPEIDENKYESLSCRDKYV